MEGCYNLRNPAVKRIMREAEELRNATEEYYAHPVEENLFEWHFTVRGPPKTDFDGGIYHGRITLPPDYPMKPPSIILLTPNGRFEVNKKICLSISGHHPESWQPSWSIRTALLAIIGFMPTHGNGAIGSLDYSPEERQKLAESSRKWKCPECGSIENLLRKEVLGADPTALSESQRMALFLPIKSQMEMDKSRISNCDVGNCDETTPELEPHSRNEASESMKFLNIAIGKNHSVSVNETSSGSSPRQRSVASLNSLPAATLPERPVDIRRSLQEILTATYITVCMWLIVILIGTLLLRRLFFSYY